MAEIVQSLFGVTPASYQRAQQDRIDAQALRYAQLDPFQQAQYGIARGANMLGGAIGGALGGQDPELQRVTMRQQIARQLNPGDPASIQQAIAALQQSGDAEGAMMLEGEYRKMQESRAKIGRDEAAAAASTAAAGRERAPPTTNEITNARAFASRAGPEGSSEYQAAFNAKLDELTAPKEAKGPGFGADAERASKAKFGKPFAELTPAEAAEVDRDLDARGLKRASATAPKVTFGPTAPQVSALEKRVGEKQADLLVEGQAIAADAAAILETNQIGKDLLNSGAITGTGANFFVALNNALSQAGVDFGYADAAANSQAYAAAMGANVGRLIKQFGAGTGLSDADRDFAEKMAGGTITLTETALRRIIAINDKVANNVIDRHNRKAEKVSTVIPLTVDKPTFKNEKPSAVSQIPTQSAPSNTAAATERANANAAIAAGAPAAAVRKRFKEKTGQEL
jgi:hypothetical protein